MAISELYAGSDTISTTEESIANNTSATTAQTRTDDGVYQLFLDLNDMVDGDQLQIRVYEKVQSSGTKRVLWDPIISHAPGSQKLWVSPSLILINGWDFTAQRVGGTDIVVDWSLRRIA